MFVLTETAKAIEGNTDPRVGMVLFITVVVSIPLLIYAIVEGFKK